MATSFDELGLGPVVVESLSAEGFEFASTFQEESIPVVRRGNNLVGEAGPGAGTLLAYGAALLDRLPPEETGPLAIVLTPTADRAVELARRLARIGVGTGHAVAALGHSWALPEHAHIVFGTPAELMRAVEGSSIKLDATKAVVLDGASQILELHPHEIMTTLLGSLPPDTQRVIIALPLSEAVEGWVEENVKRPVRVPPSAGDGERAEGAEGGDGADVPRRGSVRTRVVDGPRLEILLREIGSLLDDARHVLVHFHSDDEAADVGDFLSLHGYMAGAPGDDAVPVWLGVNALESRTALEAMDDQGAVATVSYRVPLDADALDRRHGRGGASIVLARSRELPHLERCASVAGYEAAPADEPAGALDDDISAFRERVSVALEEADLPANLLLIEPLVEKEGAARVAAALASLVRRAAATRPESDATVPAGIGGSRDTAPDAPPAWVRLFVSLGQKDAAGPGDILGAIAGEADIDGSKVGRIDLQETFSIVEVDRAVAEKVIRSLNGTTIKGRSIRVDYHRPRGGPGSSPRREKRR